MKPLTIEELKALEVGDWVWVETINAPNSSFRGYYQIRPNAERSKLIFCGIEHDYSILDYGKTWLAYKNKECAESVNDKYTTFYKFVKSYYKDIDSIVQRLQDDYAGDKPFKQVEEDRLATKCVNSNGVGVQSIKTTNLQR